MSVCRIPHHTPINRGILLYISGGLPHVKNITKFLAQFFCYSFSASKYHQNITKISQNITKNQKVFHRFYRGRKHKIKKIFKKYIDIIKSLCYNGLRIKNDSKSKLIRNFTIQKLYTHGRQGSVGFESIYRVNKNRGKKYQA